MQSGIRLHRKVLHAALQIGRQLQSARLGLTRHQLGIQGHVFSKGVHACLVQREHHSTAQQLRVRNGRRVSVFGIVVERIAEAHHPFGPSISGQALREKPLLHLVFQPHQGVLLAFHLVELQYILALSVDPRGQRFIAAHGRPTSRFKHFHHQGHGGVVQRVYARQAVIAVGKGVREVHPSILKRIAVHADQHHVLVHTQMQVLVVFGHVVQVPGVTGDVMDFHHVKFRVEKRLEQVLDGFAVGAFEGGAEVGGHGSSLTGKIGQSHAR